MILKWWRTFNGHSTYDEPTRYDEPTHGWGRFVSFTFYLPAFIYIATYNLYRKPYHLLEKKTPVQSYIYHNSGSTHNNKEVIVLKKKHMTNQPAIPYIVMIALKPPVWYTLSDICCIEGPVVFCTPSAGLDGLWVGDNCLL